MNIHEAAAMNLAPKWGEPAWTRRESWADRVERRAFDILEGAADPEEARRLALDWEMLLNEEPIIIRMVGKAWNDCIYRCESAQEKKDRLAQLGACLMEMALERARHIAEHQLEREA